MSDNKILQLLTEILVLVLSNLMLQLESWMVDTDKYITALWKSEIISAREVFLVCISVLLSCFWKFLQGFMDTNTPSAVALQV